LLSAGTSGGTGDGGASWRLKALRRAQERAAAEGKSLASVVGDRWGSVAQLVESIGATAAHDRAHVHAKRDRGGNDNDTCFKCGEGGHFARDCRQQPTGGDGRKREREDNDEDIARAEAGRGGRAYLAEVGTAGQPKMRVPSSSSDLRSRGTRGDDVRGGGGRDRDNRGGGDGGGDRGGSDRGGSDRGGSVRDRDGRDRDGRDRDGRNGDRGGSDRGGGDRGSGDRGGGVRDQGDRDRDGRGGGALEDQNDRERDGRDDDRGGGVRNRDARDRDVRGGDRGSNRGGSDRGGDRRGDSDRNDSRALDGCRQLSASRPISGGRGGRGGGDRGLSDRDRQLIATASKAANQFSSDGTFMEQFRGDEASKSTGEGREGGGVRKDFGWTPGEASEGWGTPSDGSRAPPGSGGGGGGNGGGGGGGGGGYGEEGGGGGGTFANEIVSDEDDDDLHAMRPHPFRAQAPAAPPPSAPRARLSARDTPPAAAAVSSNGGNMSAAAALRARLLGKSSTVTPLVAAAATPGLGSHEPEPEPRRKPSSTAVTEALPLVTADGRAAPGAFGRATTLVGGVRAAEGAVRRAPKTTQRYIDPSAPGEKSRYYADDDSATLRDLVAAQKHGGGEDYDRNLADNIARRRRYKVNP